MPKHVYCAECGVEVQLIRKAVKRNILDLIIPHECGEVEDIDIQDGFIPITETKKTNQKPLTDFRFLKNLEKLNTKPINPIITRVEKEKDILKSSAPPNIIDTINSMGPTPTDGNLEGPDD